MFNLGMSELILVLLIALMVFGPKKLPEVGRALGKGLGEFRQAMSGGNEPKDEPISVNFQPVEAAQDKTPKQIGVDVAKN